MGLVCLVELSACQVSWRIKRPTEPLDWDEPPERCAVLMLRDRVLKLALCHIPPACQVPWAILRTGDTEVFTILTIDVFYDCRSLWPYSLWLRETLNVQWARMFLLKAVHLPKCLQACAVPIKPHVYPYSQHLSPLFLWTASHCVVEGLPCSVGSWKQSASPEVGLEGKAVDRQRWRQANARDFSSSELNHVTELMLCVHFQCKTPSSDTLQNQSLLVSVSCERVVEPEARLLSTCMCYMLPGNSVRLHHTAPSGFWKDGWRVIGVGTPVSIFFCLFALWKLNVV